MPLQATDVSLITMAEFAALTPPDVPPVVQFDDPQPVEAIPEDTAPEVVPTPDEPPVLPVPDEVAAPELDVSPPEPEVAPEPPVDPVEQPVLPTPPVLETPPVIAEPDEVATPAPAPRVAPEPAAAPEPDTEIAETETPPVAPDETAETISEETPATAPQEAATEIVTEAETPASAAPVRSMRPTARPARPDPVVAQDPTPPSDPVADAVAEAVASTTPTPPARPTGPPLTGGEKEGLRVAVQKCWNVGSLSSEAISTTVVVAVAMGRDGRPDTGSIKMLSFSGGSDGAAGQAFAAARRAIIRCGAKGYDLPVEKYSQWQDIEMTFNPEKMRIK